MNEEILYDARFIHPFNCIIAGPTGSGKSTFVFNLLSRMSDLISVKYDYILVLLGNEDSVKDKVEDKFDYLRKKYPSTKITIKNLYSEYQTREELIHNLNFDLIKNDLDKTKNGCIIFDDLMCELSQSGLLVPLFTKISAHNNLSNIVLTQNIFYKGGSKNATDHTTIYRNTQYLILFSYKLDNTVFSNIARRIKSYNSADLLSKLEFIAKKYRYVMIDGKIDQDPKIQYRSDIFSTEPIPFQRVFSNL